MKDPYETLGVARNASPDEIKRAYRGKAKSVHPDAGGRQEEMADLSGAYALLSSPERRKAYDETGNDRQRDAFTLAINLATNIGITILLKEENHSPKKIIDIHEEKYTDDYRKKKAELTAQLTQLKKAELRVKNRPENDFMGNFFQGQRRAMERDLEKNEEDFAIQKKAIELIRGYSFEEPRPRGASYYGGTTASTTGFGV